MQFPWEIPVFLGGRIEIFRKKKNQTAFSAGVQHRPEHCRWLKKTTKFGSDPSVCSQGHVPLSPRAGGASEHPISTRGTVARQWDTTQWWHWDDSLETVCFKTTLFIFHCLLFPQDEKTAPSPSICTWRATRKKSRSIFSKHFPVARASPHGLLPASWQGGLELGRDTKREESEGQGEQSGAGGRLLCRICTAHARVLFAGRLRSTHFEMSQDLLARPNKNTSPRPRMARAGKEVSKIGSSPCLCRGRGCDSAEELFVGLRSQATRPAASPPAPPAPAPWYKSGSFPGTAGLQALHNAARRLCCPHPLPPPPHLWPESSPVPREAFPAAAGPRGCLIGSQSCGQLNSDAHKRLRREMLMSTERRAREALNRISCTARADECPRARLPVQPGGASSRASSQPLLAAPPEPRRFLA